MTREVRLSKRATKKLDKLFYHLENNWSSNVKKGFVDKLDRCIRIIVEYPESNEKSKYKKGLYRCVITKQTIL